MDIGTLQPLCFLAALSPYFAQMDLAAAPLPLSFVHILNLHTVYGSDTHGPKIRFNIINESFLTDKNGIYLITKGSKKAIVYCGTCSTRSFRNSLLFNNPKDLHFHNTDRVRSEVGRALQASHIIEVHAQTEEQLRQQLIALGASPADLGSLPAIKKVLTKLLGPEW